ncbi:dihydroxyacetone kinase [Paenibacillus sp. J45TS6]|uniref:dihydroxyacetone kinase subunit DhaK n=1 Tax=Paenibacillus sp. J45TS6 TaxID=2807196 RepID=UPI001B185319|nr:dihydroxyacetone kinase subunit DhaK [Paenibacillus sp. J45TS6]GIP45685.1 dihydroxyacetone kinase [Paenibacillus sp. J45TS6]
MKKIMNKPETLVREMASGLILAHPELTFDSRYKIIAKKELNPSKVTLISGGGSGHEPAHAGFVGKGMLDLAVCGDVFASPSQIQVYQALRGSRSDKGTLLIIKNYSGDIMNFRNAAHLAREDGITVDYVKVEDDIAVEDSLYTVGKRGVAGTVFVHKIAGAAAELGKSLAEVKEAAQKAADRTKSIGFALTSCTVPAKGSPTFQLNEDEMEYGVGIHGEPGIRREKILSADELAGGMVEDLLKHMDPNGEDEYAVLVNGFGGSPLQELYLLNNAVMREMKARGKKVMKVLVGDYMTSIDMAGASLSLMQLDEELKNLLAVECETPALTMRGPLTEVIYTDKVEEVQADGGKEASYTVETSEEHSKVQNEQFSLSNLIYYIDKMSEIIIKNEGPFCDLDSHAGDGDFGTSIATGFKQLKKEWDHVLEKSSSMSEFLDACSLIIMEKCGGASGPIWGSAFRAASKSAGEKEVLGVQDVADLFSAVVKGIQDTGERSFGRGAVVGDKTLIDALVPMADSWQKSAEAGEDLKTASEKAAQAAVDGAKKTEEIVARMGRAGTVGERSIGYPDAGAYAIGFIFTELSEAMK